MSFQSNDDLYATVKTVVLQVAAMNALRGLLTAEMEENPETVAVCVVLGTDGSFELTATNAQGLPLGGYAI